MIITENLKLLKRQKYSVAGKHSAVQVCRWTKNSLTGKGECYKHKFYGIPSWRCCEISPAAVWCDNHCLHCWRAIEATQGKKMPSRNLDSPEVIVKECIKGRNLLMSGFGGHDTLDKKRYLESREPSHFAISLIGEPTLYPKIGELVELLRKKGKTSFIVTNGLHPEVIKKLEKKKQLPTQLYVSLNSSNKPEFLEWHKSSLKDAWKKYNQTLDLMNKITKKGKRTILRMTIAKNKNTDAKHIREFSEIIKKANPLFIEVKSYMPLGYARARLGYEYMLTSKETRDFAKALAKELGKEYTIIGEHYPSRICLVGKKKDKKRMKIQKKEI
ncbi:4-demethylwyosine synthase TYW1 [Candidatus Pacearchaeota archaeon]|nr:4-demethylwyosine synthase TYW1 [Candidatus Pacearchaeota archaeon]